MDIEKDTLVTSNESHLPKTMMLIRMSLLLLAAGPAPVRSSAGAASAPLRYVRIDVWPVEPVVLQNMVEWLDKGGKVDDR